ncbi:testis-specific gene A8 protein-like [Calliphora vicina]|uniref:testis-specific gene A8 protein-like n=1 Tax=Calliphora vicina TaxID=7373 RepID=UPI00325A827B
MAKFIIVLCAFIACAAAKPGIVAPLAYTAPFAAATPLAYSSPLAYSHPLAYSAPLTYAAAPVAYANAHLDAAYASSRVDIKQNYNAAVVPATYAAAAAVPVATPFAAPVAPLKYTAAPVLL